MIAVLGVDGGTLPAESAELLAHATLVAGGRRHLDALAPAGAEQVALTGALEPALDALAAHDGDACVLASGDPGFYGIVRALAARVGAVMVDFEGAHVVGTSPGARDRVPAEALA